MAPRFTSARPALLITRTTTAVVNSAITTYKILMRIMLTPVQDQRFEGEAKPAGRTDKHTPKSLDFAWRAASVLLCLKRKHPRQRARVNNKQAIVRGNPCVLG